MKSSATSQQTSEVYGASSVIDPNTVKVNVFKGIMNWFDKFLLVFVIGGLLAGIWVASVSQPLVDQVDSIVNGFMNLYSYFAPLAIFLILTPSLARLFVARKMGRFGVFVIGWFGVRKILASVWAIIFIMVVFRIPFLPQGSLSLVDGILQTVNSLGKMALTSPYFWAMYAAFRI